MRRAAELTQAKQREQWVAFYPCHILKKKFHLEKGSSSSKLKPEKKRIFPNWNY